MIDAAQWAAEKLGYQFKDKSLLGIALTHRSARGANNERLEFLGDGLLNFVIGAELYRLHPDANEGDLSRLRAALVRGDTLAEIALELALGDVLNLGSGVLKSGGFRHESILADALEAVFGAMYLDSSDDDARQCILGLFEHRFATLPSAQELKDPKTRLQEYLQAHGQEPPTYSLVNTTGEAHQQEFTIRCDMPEPGLSAQGTGRSRRKAEQEAAEAVLNNLEQKKV